MIFTNLEKKAIAKILMEIAVADGNHAPEEMEDFARLKEPLELTDEIIHEACFFERSKCIEILKNLGMPEKRFLGIIFNRMAYSDGNLDERELRVLNEVSENAGIPLS